MSKVERKAKHPSTEYAMIEAWLLYRKSPCPESSRICWITRGGFEILPDLVALTILAGIMTKRAKYPQLLIINRIEIWEINTWNPATTE